MLKKVLLFSCEPGGAEVIVPVAKLLAETRDYDVTVTGYGYAIERFERHQIPYTLVDKIEKNDNEFLNRFTPDLLITSATSIPAKDMSEKHLWYLAKNAGIKSIAMLDQWQNYSIRFSGTSDKEWLAYLPDAINCINDIGKKEMIGEGFAENILHSLGQPYLDCIGKFVDKIDSALIRKKLNISQEENIVLFVSEAIEENYSQHRGYTQYEVLYTFLKNSTPVNHTSILIKLHPKDDVRKFEAIRTAFTQHKLMFISGELTSLESIAISSRVFGMTSITLIEAYILGKSVVSIQPNLKINDPFVLSRYGYVQVILNADFQLDLESDTIPELKKRFVYEFKQAKFLSLVNKFIRHSCEK